jgi:hypothetical protein
MSNIGEFIVALLTIIFMTVWMAVLPTVGLLWSIGWLS